MSRPPKRRRPTRIHRWTGYVNDVTRTEFSATLVAVDSTCPELYATWPKRLLPDVEAGDVFNLYVHRRGRKTRTVLRRKDLGRWTAEEVEQIHTRAAERARDLGQWTEVL